MEWVCVQWVYFMNKGDKPDRSANKKTASEYLKN